MKTLAICLITILFFAITPDPSGAQNGNIDHERMQRDLRIMERTLDELFTLRGASADPIFVTPNSFRFGGSSQGTYLPGFGVLLTVPDRTPYTFRLPANEPDSENHRFYLGEGDEVSELSIRDRLREFLTHYAPAIGQLEPEEQIMVLYGVDIRSLSPFFPNLNVFPRGFRMNESDHGQPEELPVIAMSVSRQEMDALRSGRISEAAFLERIRTSVTPRSELNRNHDFTIFSGILETGLQEPAANNAFNRQTDEDREIHFTMSRKPSHLHLETFGVIYKLELTLSPRDLGQFGNQLNVALRRALGNVSMQFDSLRVNSALFNRNMTEEEREEARRDLEETQQELAKRHQEMTQRLEQEQSGFGSQSEDLQRSVDRIVNTLRELILDYGHTLKSLKQEDHLLISVSVNLPGHLQAGQIPQRTDLRASKSVLDQLNRGVISREEAGNRITEQRW